MGSYRQSPSRPNRLGLLVEDPGYGIAGWKFGRAVNAYPDRIHDFIAGLNRIFAEFSAGNDQEPARSIEECLQASVRCVIVEVRYRNEIKIVLPVPSHDDIG